LILLGSADANPSIGEEAKTFDRLVGTWDADFSFYRADGSVFHKKGELLFGWVMDGHAVQDLWIGYPTEGQKGKFIGIFWGIFNLGAVVGASVSLGQNFHSTVRIKIYFLHKPLCLK